VYPKFFTGTKENLWRAALWPLLFYCLEFTNLAKQGLNLPFVTNLLSPFPTPEPPSSSE